MLGNLSVPAFQALAAENDTSGTDSVKELNQILHEYGEYIIGRLGIPYRQRGVNIISVAMDAPQDMINAMTGKIGRLAGISAKTVCSKKAENI